jgi:cytochrome c553
MSADFILKIHISSVTVFVAFYLVKTFLLLSGKDATLDVFSKKTRFVEMIFSLLFLITGISLIIITGGIKTLQIVKLVLVFASIPLAVIGFKKKIKVLASCSLLMLISAYVLAEAARSKPYPVKHAPANEQADGKYLFEHNCIYCHGTDGKKSYREAADLSLSVKDAAKVTAVIKNGSNNKMPAYGGLLSEKEIQAVADYIITLRE